MLPTLHLRSAVAILAGVALFGACKGSARNHEFEGESGAQNSTWGGPGGSGMNGVGGEERTDRVPDLSYEEEFPLHLEREILAQTYDGLTQRFQEDLLSDGQGNLRLELKQVWDAETSAWIAPHPFTLAMYETRSFYLVRHRDLHLGTKGVYSNYLWEDLPGTVIMAGRNCVTTRAHSLHGLGPVDLVHEVGTGLLLGWTIWDEAAAEVRMQLTTTVVEENPNLSGVTWSLDLVNEREYLPSADPALLGFTPVAMEFPPVGFYQQKALLVDLRSHVPDLNYLYLEHWTDGLRKLFVAQHHLARDAGDPNGEFVSARVSHEGGLSGVESDYPGRRVIAVGMLPATDTLLVVGDLRE